MILLAAAYFFALRPLLQLLNGYASKRICSSHFIAGRTLEDIQTDDLIYPATWCNGEIDPVNMTASSSIIGLNERRAAFRPGFGCTLVPKFSSLRPTPLLPTIQAPSGYWPYGNMLQDTTFSYFDQNRLNLTVEEAFGTADRTRAIIVAHRGHIIAEQYQKGFNKDTELLGWSMAKSIANNLVGILTKEGRLSVDKTSLIDEWTDERSQINLEELLSMSSDLDWNEEDGYLSDVTTMLYLNDQASDYAIDKKIRQQIGTSYIYSSGTTNIISEIIKNIFDTEEEYLKYPHEALFNKLGINATMELDADNNYIMSSYTYMTARDWTKLGQFWLQNGNWDGQQILPKNWIRYSTGPGIGINSSYGAHFWLNTDSRLYPSVPADMYSARGFQGQQIAVIPSLDLVITRFGVDEGIETFDHNKFISSIIASLGI